MFGLGKGKYECPVCGYRGTFVNHEGSTGSRTLAKCPTCGSLERHRLQILVLKELVERFDFSTMKVLHFAPEKFLSDFFRRHFADYTSADLNMHGVDFTVDLQELPFYDSVYDLIFASHVLEHIPDDLKAMKEIRRVLKPGGIAVLPVPIIASTTVEYPKPNPLEEYHCRAPGLDYFEKYGQVFREVKIYSSNMFDGKYQLFIYEDRTKLLNHVPLRPVMPGKMHRDFVPICFS